MSENLKKEYEEPTYEIVEIKDNIVKTGPFNGSSTRLFANSELEPSEGGMDWDA